MSLYFCFVRLSITSDGWSSVAKDSYMSLTAHYIDQEWNLVSRCLKTQYHPESHTAINLANFFQEALKEYGLKTGFVVTITTDSAPNMIAAARDAGEFYIFAYSIHNVSQRAFFVQNIIIVLAVDIYLNFIL